MSKKKDLKKLLEETVTPEDMLEIIQDGLNAEKSTRQGLVPDHKTRIMYIELVAQITGTNKTGKQQENQKKIKWNF